MNVAVISGNLGSMSEVKESGDHRYVRLRVAVNGRSGRPVWITVVCFDGLAEAVSRSLQKGSKVVVRGRLEADKKGEIVLVAQEVEFAGRSQRQKPQKETTDLPPMPPELDEDEVPF